MRARYQRDKAKSMMSEIDMAQRGEALRVLFHTKLGVRSRDLAQAFKRAGRRLPKHLREQGKVLAEAETYVAHPKLAKRVDPVAVGKAFQAVTGHLKTIDAADRRKGFWLSLAGSVVFNLLAISVMFVLFLLWRGYI